MDRFLAFLHRHRAVGISLVGLALLIWLVPIVVAAMAAHPMAALYVLGIVAALVAIVTASTDKDASLGASFVTIGLLAFAAVAMLAPMLLA